MLLSCFPRAGDARPWNPRPSWSPIPPGTVLLLFVWGRSEVRRTEASSPACRGGPDLSVAQSSQAPGWGHLTSLLPTFSSGRVGMDEPLLGAVGQPCRSRRGMPSQGVWMWCSFLLLHWRFWKAGPAPRKGCFSWLLYVPDKLSKAHW